MSSSALAQHRARLTRRGMVRVEVTVTADDASLVRAVAAALVDPARQGSVRTLLRQCFGSVQQGGLKALLAAAPLEGIDLSRAEDFGRSTEF